MATIIQDLNLEVGQKAICLAGYPKLAKVVVECIKDFKDAPNAIDVVDNPYSYIKIVSHNGYGLITSHCISSNWTKIN